MQNKESTFSPIKKQKRIFEEVALNIKESIFRGVWKSGDRLPSENTLADQFRVSRHTIREALRALELSGIIEVKTGVTGGSFVKDSIGEAIVNLYLDAFQMEKITAKEFTAARLVIEKGILNEVIDIADEQDIKNLQEYLVQYKTLLSKKEVTKMDHYGFHSLLAKASKNRAYMIFERSINAIHHQMRERVVEGTPEDIKATKTAYREHEKILDAIVKKDRKKAIKILEQHILAIGKTFDP